MAETSAVNSATNNPQSPLAPFLNGLRALLTQRPLQLAALVLALAGFTLISMMYKFSVMDPDLYWHMAVGDWIVQHGAVPHTGILSRTAAATPWIAYSWGAEVLVSRAYAWLGLMGVALYGTALFFLVALSLLWGLLRLARNFWIALLLWCAASLGSLFTLMPRPVFFSMAFYVVLLTLLLEAVRTGETKRLWLLPPFFLVWANLHIQFVYGLFIMGVLFGAVLLQEMVRRTSIPWLAPHKERIDWLPFQMPQLAGLIAVCTLATCIGPYTYHVYGVVLGYGRATRTYATIQELQPVSYLFKEQYLPLFITALAFFLLGARKKLAPYQTLLLVAATVISVRTVRDTWFICFTAALLVADAVGARASAAESSPAEAAVPVAQRQRQRFLEAGGVAAAWFVLACLIANGTGYNTLGLNREIATTYPIGACNFLRSAMPPGPMYNTLNWGGFLTWYLPMYPVAYDGRNDLYEGPVGNVLMRTQTEPGTYTEDPYLKESGFILVDVKEQLAASLSVNPQYRMIYRDRQAMIFVPNTGAASSEGVQP